MFRKLFIVAALLLSAGCAHTSHPGSAPKITLDVVSGFDGNYSVELINDQPDKTLQLYLGIGAHKYYTDLNEWTQFLMEDFARELEKRGVAVSPDSPNKILIKISDFKGIQGWVVIRVYMTFRLANYDGSWSKEFKVTEAGHGLGRAMGGVIYRAVEALMNDPEVMDKMKIR